MLEVRDPADVRTVAAEAPGATAEGATATTCGVDRPTGASLEHGCYVSPTIVCVDTKHSLWREETAAVRFAW